MIADGLRASPVYKTSGVKVQPVLQNMIQLFQFSTSPFTEVVRRAMGHKGIAYRVTEVERLQIPQGEYKHVSPTGKFPAILDGEKAIWDSTDIVHHVDQSYAGPAVVTSNPRNAAMAHAIEEWADESQ